MSATLGDIGGHVGHAGVQKHGIQPKSTNYSRLMEARMATGVGGETPNFCPHGCGLEHLDEHGYCCHLVGFTVMDKIADGRHVAGKFYEPVARDDDGHLRTKLTYVKVKGKLRPVYAKVDLTKHKLERITTSHRVYENVPVPADVLEAMRDDEPDEGDDLTDAELEALTAPNTGDTDGR